MSSENLTNIDLIKKIPETPGRKYLLAAAQNAEKADSSFTTLQVRCAIARFFYNCGLYHESLDLFNQIINDLILNKNYDYSELNRLTRGSFFSSITDDLENIKRKLNGTNDFPSALKQIRILKYVACQHAIDNYYLEWLAGSETGMELEEIGKKAAHRKNYMISSKLVRLFKKTVNTTSNPLRKYAIISRINNLNTENAQTVTRELIDKMGVKELGDLKPEQKLEVAEMLYTVKGDHELIQSILKTIHPDKLYRPYKFSYYLLQKRSGD